MEFEYLCGTVYTHPNVIIRQWLYLIGVLNGVKYLFKNRKIIDRLFLLSGLSGFNANNPDSMLFVRHKMYWN